MQQPEDSAEALGINPRMDVIFKFPFFRPSAASAGREAELHGMESFPELNKLKLTDWLRFCCGGGGGGGRWSGAFPQWLIP